MLKVSEIKAKKSQNQIRKVSRVPLDYEKLIAKITRLKPKYLNLGLFLAVLGVASFGVAMVYSASSYNAGIHYNNRYHFFTRQLFGLFIGTIAMIITYKLDYRVYKRRSVWILVGAAVLLLMVFLPGIGLERLGARRWIGLGGFQIQPSEIAKFAFIIFAASIASTAPKKAGVADGRPLEQQKQLSFKQLSLILAVGGGFCVLILLQPNLSIVMTLGATMFVCLFLFGARTKHLMFLMIPVLILVPAMLIAEPYRIARLVAFVDPWATPRAEGFQLIQSLYALGNGGLFGRGFGNSTQKYMFLPFSESDFIFSIIAEEFGLFGATLFLLTLCYIVFKIFKVGKQCRDMFGKFLCFGIGALIFIQSSINIAVVTGSIPPTGLPLPFVSFGGTSIAVFMAGIGIVLNIHKQNLKSRT